MVFIDDENKHQTLSISFSQQQEYYHLLIFEIKNLN